MRKDLLIKAIMLYNELYPGGAEHPDMKAIIKKHKPQKMQDMAQEMFAKDNFDDAKSVVDNILKIITRASLVSVFEKVKFKDTIRDMLMEDKQSLSDALYNLLHDNKAKGFEDMVQLLAKDKMAKWPIMTVIPYYMYPKTEVFVKPTTAKGIIKTFELKGLVYHPRPTYEFYTKFKNSIFEMRNVIGEGFDMDNAAFTGILMMMSDL